MVALLPTHLPLPPEKVRRQWWQQTSSDQGTGMGLLMLSHLQLPPWLPALEATSHLTQLLCFFLIAVLLYDLK